MSIYMNRITPGMTEGTILQNLTSSMNQLDNTTQQLTSGLTINEPSDNPYGTSQVLSDNDQLSSLSNYATNASDGTAWANTADGSLSNLSSIVQQVQQIVVEANNGSLNSGDLASMGTEVNQLIDQVKSIANTTYDGNYIFSGTDTSTPPYQTGTDDTYQGNTGAVLRQVGPGVTTQVNVDLSSLLGSGQAADDGGLLGTLRNISDDLSGGSATNLANLSGVDQQDLTANMNTLEGLETTVGATSNSLTLATSRITDWQQNVTTALAGTQDTNVAQATMNYSLEQASYQAALKAGASIIQTSLLDFLSTS